MLITDPIFQPSSTTLISKTAKKNLKKLRLKQRKHQPPSNQGPFQMLPIKNSKLMSWIQPSLKLMSMKLKRLTNSLSTTSPKGPSLISWQAREWVIRFQHHLHTLQAIKASKTIVSIYPRQQLQQWTVRVHHQLHTECLTIPVSLRLNRQCRLLVCTRKPTTPNQ